MLMCSDGMPTPYLSKLAGSYHGLFTASVANAIKYETWSRVGTVEWEQ